MPLTIRPEIAPLRIDEDGVVRVGPTRVTIDSIVGAYHEGFSAEEIAEQYPAVEIGDVSSALAYYLRHRAELDAYLEGRGRDAQAVRQTYEARFPPGPGLRQRLQARRG